MPLKAKVIIAIALVLIIAGVAALFYFGTNRTPGKYDAFAQCLTSKGAKFYGAYWCPHCQNQKAMFGTSEKYLPYIECSTPNGQGQLPVCNDKNITGYPTWEFADGSRLSGEVPLKTLAEKTGCTVPE